MFWNKPLAVDEFPRDLYTAHFEVFINPNKTWLYRIYDNETTQLLDTSAGRYSTRKQAQRDIARAIRDLMNTKYRRI